ncbi:MAG: ATP phosphoribosyltransferase, partial [Bacteroidetes bacterium]|nr:ATP phosphoribosyltransferase [Bacteroidota bacterium]
LKGAIAAEGKVGLKMNIKKSDLPKIIGIIPALRKPTVSPLYDDEWVAIETIIDERVVRIIVPELKRNGAEGIIEYPLNKIVP